MAIKQTEPQLSPRQMKLLLLLAGIGPLVGIALFLQSKGFFG